jgi:hypothetical protein
MSPHDDTLQKFEEDNNFAEPMRENIGAMNQGLSKRNAQHDARQLQ